MSLEITNKETTTLSISFVRKDKKNNKEEEIAMNRADAAFANVSSDPRFSCDYTGRHDHGELPPQRRSEHEMTLEYLEWARGKVAEHFEKQQREDNNKKCD